MYNNRDKYFDQLHKICFLSAHLFSECDAACENDIRDHEVPDPVVCYLRSLSSIILDQCVSSMNLVADFEERLHAKKEV